MDAGLIARRYATVLHDFAADNKCLDEVYVDAQLIRQVLSQQAGAQRFFESPLRKSSEKKKLLEDAFAKEVRQETMRFIDFLVEKERISLLQQIMLVFCMLYKKEKNICTAAVTTAKPLGTEQQRRIVEQIEQKLVATGHKVSAVDATFRTDARIIGGIILEVDGMQVDDSVASKLRQLEKQLTV